MNDVVVVVPLYKPTLSPLEAYSLAYSLRQLEGRPLVFIHPTGLVLDEYLKNYPQAKSVDFLPDYFKSIRDYSRLLLTPDFYKKFLRYDYLLILQTDVLVLNRDLDYWLGLPFDYIGAPWPNGIELLVNAGKFDGARGKKIKALVGNGGFSLRRTRACLRLIEEFPDLYQIFHHTGSNEDIFFAVAGMLSEKFILPNEVIASLFCLECDSEGYFAVNQKLPFAVHAWWKYSPRFWLNYVPDARSYFDENFCPKPEALRSD